MRKIILALVLAAVLFFGRDAAANEYPEADFTWHFVQDEMMGESNARKYAQEVLDLVNRERSQRGIAPLQLSDELMDAAAVRAEEITQVFSHTRPNGKSCFSVLRKKGAAAENIAAGSSTPEEVVNRWMHSDGHRKNMLNKKYKELGVGHVYKPGSEYGHYWVQLFRSGR